MEPRNFGVGTDGNANSSGDTNTKTTGITIQNAGSETLTKTDHHIMLCIYHQTLK